MEKGEWKIAEGKPSGGFPLDLLMYFLGFKKMPKSKNIPQEACRALARHFCGFYQTKRETGGYCHVKNNTPVGKDLRVLPCFCRCGEELKKGTTRGSFRTRFLAVETIGACLAVADLREAKKV